MTESSASFSLHFGAMVEPISDQLAAMGYAVEGQEATHWQNDADAITRLLLRRLLPPRQAEAARRRLVTKIHRGVLAGVA